MRLAAAVAGDVNQTRSRTVDEIVGVTASDVDIVAHVWRDSITPVDLEVELTDSTTGEIAIDFGDADGWLASRPAAGVWLLEYEVTFGDGEVLTVMATWPDEIVVRADHDAPEEP